MIDYLQSIPNDSWYVGIGDNLRLKYSDVSALVGENFKYAVTDSKQQTYHASNEAAQRKS
jgi:hypothetical protein